MPNDDQTSELDVQPRATRQPLPVREGYDRWAPHYDSDGNPLVALEERVFDAALGPVHGLDVLDLGCGTGRHAIRLARAGARVRGLDLSPGMLAVARRAAADLALELAEHDLTRPLPCAPASYDRVVAGLLVEHLTDLRAFYAEVARVLRPGGVALISTLHPAMALRSVQARFTDPATGEVQPIESRPQAFGELILPALGSGLALDDLQEHAGDDTLAALFPRAERYRGWPMLALLRFVRPPHHE
jgi:SAM-dependent methyltransferase